jgi:O-antigen/teichoic acid export membrane protein
VKNRIGTAYATSLLGLVSGLLTNLWLLRQVTSEVDAPTFGIYAFVLQITAYLGALQLAFDFATSQRIAGCLGRGDTDGANRAWWELARASRFAALAAIGATLLISCALSFGIGIAAHHAQIAARIALATGATQALTFLSRRYAAALIGSDEQAAVNLTTVGSTISATLIAYGLLRAGTGVYCLALGNLAIALVTITVLRALAGSRLRWPSPNPPEHDPELARELFRFGWVAELGGLAWTVESTCDVVILGWLRGADAVAYYALWWRFPQMIFDLSARLTNAAFPSFAAEHGRAPEEAARLLGRIGQLTIGLGGAALVGIAWWLPGFVNLWLSGKYALSDGTTIALAMGLTVWLRALGNLGGMFTIAVGLPQVSTRLSIAQAALKLALATVLIARFGIAGAPMASVAASLLQVLGFAFALASRRMLDGKLVRNALVLGALAIAAAVIGRAHVPAVGIWGFVAGTAATALVWAVLWLAATRDTTLWGRRG